MKHTGMPASGQTEPCSGNISRNDLGCILMASGMGRRFGSNKLLADFGGKPLILHALEATEGLFSRRIVVTRHPEVADLCREYGAEVLLHDKPLRSDTIRLGVLALSDCSGWAFCPGDQPLLRRESVEKLVRMHLSAPEYIHRLCACCEMGMPVVFPKWAQSELLTLPDGKGGGYIIHHHPDRIRPCPIPDPWELQDADTPATLRQLLDHACKISQKTAK